MYLIDSFRDKSRVLGLLELIKKENNNESINIMEVCGGHTHSIMKYGLNKILPKNINFLHGPGCPVCVMPKIRIDLANILARQQDIILLTLGDMLKVPGSDGSLQKTRSLGADVRFIYSPMEALNIAKQNPNKKIVFFAIGFETTTPMSAALIEHTIKNNINNLFFVINHILVPPPIKIILSQKPCYVDALIAPSHVSVITGSNIYKDLLDFKIPIIVSGFEPVDILDSVLKILRQKNNQKAELEIQYSRAVSQNGNVVAKKLIEKYFDLRTNFEWRGLGNIADSALKLRDEFSFLDAEIIYRDILPTNAKSDNKNCICGEILRGVKKPNDCKVFGSVCTPQNPLGSCMVSSEGACAAYYKYGG